jgi:hypothetical protein
VVDKEASVEDAIEQEQTLGEAAPTDHLDPEAPEADVVEQHTPVGRSHYPVQQRLSHEVDEGDAAEQSLPVPGDDEDDYR